MKVSLAAEVRKCLVIKLIHRYAQVLSESVAEGLCMQGSVDTFETQRFVRMMDKLFDCLNVRHPKVYLKRRKHNLKPYEDADDARLNVRLKWQHTIYNTLYTHFYCSGWKKIS